MYVADIHGSETIFRKWITAQSIYEIDVSMLAGDLSGKVIVPIIKEADGTYTCRHEGRVEKASRDNELDEIKGGLRARGIYPYILTQEELQRLKASTTTPEKLDEFFTRVITDDLNRVLTSLEEKIPPEKTVILTPGNDDVLGVDAVIDKHKRIINPLGKLVQLPMGYEMISMEYSNPTPWNTPRECSEEELWKRLEALVPLVSGDWRKVICNFHAPPYGSRLDLAPKLDKNLRPVHSIGVPEYANVGSKSVRRFLEKYQPLLSLHGHIHEASGVDQIGKTLAFNPGSEYTTGVFRGVVVELNEQGVANWFKIG